MAGVDSVYIGQRPYHLQWPTNRTHCLTKTTPTMSPVTHVLNIYTGPDPFICIYFQPQSPSIAFAYVQVTYNISPTTVTNYSNMGSMYFDPHGRGWLIRRLLHDEGPAHSDAPHRHPSQHVHIK